MLFIGQLHIFRVTVVNMSTRVGKAAYSGKIRAVRAGMRLSIAVEHPGDLRLTVTESFSEYYVSWLIKKENLWFHMLSLEYLSVAVFPLGR